MFYGLQTCFFGGERNYVAINQTYVLLIRKTGFSVFLIKCFYHLEDMKYISWCGRDKPEKKSGFTFMLSISRFICFIVYIFIFSFWHYNGLLSNLVKYIYFYQRYLIFLFLWQPRSTIFSLVNFSKQNCYCQRNKDDMKYCCSDKNTCISLLDGARA